MHKYIIGIIKINNFEKKNSYTTKYMIKIPEDQCIEIDNFLNLKESSKIFNISTMELLSICDKLNINIATELKMLSLSANANNASLHMFNTDLELTYEDFDMLINTWISTGEIDKLTGSKINL